MWSGLSPLSQAEFTDAGSSFSNCASFDASADLVACCTSPDNGLRLDRGMPQRTVEHHVAGVREVEARARGAQAEQEHAGTRIGLECGHDFLPVLRLAGEDVRLDVARVTFLFEQLEHLHE